MSNPRINYIWIGDPPSATAGGVPGHDISGPVRMSELNKMNRLRFWCLDKNVVHYQSILNLHGIEVLSIESYLASHASGKLSEEAQKVLIIMRESLKEGRNRIKDRVTFKDVFSLFLLLDGDYVLDTNVRPSASATSCFLVSEDKFRLPAFTAKPSSSAETDCWMMFSPLSNSSRIQGIINSYYDLWFQKQKIYEKEGASINYDKALTELMVPSLYGDGRDIAFWQTNDQRLVGYVEVKGLGIKKYYYNTHYPEVSSEYEALEILAKKKATHSLMSTASTSLSLDNVHEEKKHLLLNQPSRGKVYNQLFSTIVCYGEGNKEKFLDLIKYGADVNQQLTSESHLGEAPLHLAVIYDHPECVQILLEHKANPSLEASYMEGALAPGVFLKKSGNYTPYKLASELKAERCKQLLKVPSGIVDVEKPATDNVSDPVMSLDDDVDVLPSSSLSFGL